MSSATGEAGATGTVTVVLGASGGSGTSLVAGALALAWARAGSAAWLLELDADRGDLADAWGMQPERSLDDLVAVAGELDAGHLRQAAHRHESGVRAIVAPPRAGAAARWSAAMVERLAGAAAAAAGEGGRVAVDAGAGLDDRAAAAARRARVVVVCAPTLSAARRARRISEAVGPVPGCSGVVVSRGPARGEIGPRALGRAIGATVLAELPWAEREAESLAAGRWPRGRRCRLAGAIEGLAEALA